MTTADKVLNCDALRILGELKRRIKIFILSSVHSARVTEKDIVSEVVNKVYLFLLLGFLVLWKLSMHFGRFPIV